MLRNHTKIIIGLLLISAIGLAPTVQAATQTQYTIPLGVSRWNQYEIAFKIQSTPKWAHDTVLVAMNLWNQAQEWFKQAYYPNGLVYHLSESQNSTNQVAFENTYSPDYGGYAQGDRNGRTTTRSEVVLVLVYASGREISPEVLLELAVHEFGHVLGLEHTAVLSDIMCSTKLNQCENTDNVLPSTLDLYAVHIIAEGQLPTSITLPASITYMPAPVNLPAAPVGLIVEAPVGANVTFDGTKIPVGSFLLVTAGIHEIQASSIIDLRSGERLVFAGFKGAMALFLDADHVKLQPNIISYNATISVTYRSEYYLKLESLGWTVGSDWYEKGSTATFKARSQTEPMNGVLGTLGGKWQFEGWYENGIPLTHSIAGSIYMDKAHVLETHWQPDYTGPYLVLMVTLAAGLVLVVLVMIRQRREQ
jgi:hypothetical protein